MATPAAKTMLVEQAQQMSPARRASLMAFAERNMPTQVTTSEKAPDVAA